MCLNRPDLSLSVLLCVSMNLRLAYVCMFARQGSKDVNKDLTPKDQDKNKDLTPKDQDKDKDKDLLDLTPKDKDKDKDLTPKDQDKDNDLKYVLKESLRTRTRTRTTARKIILIAHINLSNVQW